MKDYGQCDRCKTCPCQHETCGLAAASGVLWGAVLSGLFWLAVYGVLRAVGWA